VFNERKMLDASHVVVFCAKTAMDDAWLKLVVDQEDADNYVFNERKMLDASHVVVFCAKTAMDDAWLKLVVD
ncbi:hypothetical protein QS891_26725, partial [Escherichia coli]|nr:hypothetical protein [Escherichia coli]